MLRGFRVIVALLVALPGAAADNPYRLKPGARGDLCLECHDTFRETLSLPHVHTPVKAGECSDCHDPHASSHGKLLAADPSRICQGCHQEVVSEDAVSSHRSVREGDCLSCHDPHASQHANNLVRSGNDLCNGCHDDVARSVAEARFGHAPVRDDCLSCHDPHASSTAGSLLAQGEPDVCVACHDATGTAFRERHMEYPVDRGRCTSCHDPHGSDEGGILLANVHRPVVTRMCEQCHPEPAAPDALQAKRSGFDLCRGCHSEMVNNTLTSRRLHWPVADREACLNCHNPHASRVSGLLSEPMKPLCGSCHGDVMARGERSAKKHEPVAEGECVTCHDPHGSDNLFLFETADSIELCANCHDWKQHSTHPIGEGIVDMRNPNLRVDCTSCHRSHGSPHKYLASFDIKADLCVDCHETFGR